MFLYYVNVVIFILMALDLILVVFGGFFFRVGEGENKYDKTERVSKFKLILYIIAVGLCVVYVLLNLIF